VVLLNRGGSEQEITATWQDLGYPDHLSAGVRDLWEHKDLGRSTGNFASQVAPHGVVMVSVKP
jgi:alpha-galactosidase